MNMYLELTFRYYFCAVKAGSSRQNGEIIVQFMLKAPNLAQR